MTQSDHHAFTEQTLNEALGIVVTEEGKARGRHRLAEAAEAWPPERWERVRAKYGIKPKAA